MIKEYCNLIGKETPLVTSKKSEKSQILQSLDDDLHARHLSYQLISSSNTNEQKILQFDCLRDTPGHTHPKVVASDATMQRN